MANLKDASVYKKEAELRQVRKKYCEKHPPGFQVGDLVRHLDPWAGPKLGLCIIIHAGSMYNKKKSRAFTYMSQKTGAIEWDHEFQLQKVV